jgi:thiamine biosynthesis lipoprotein
MTHAVRSPPTSLALAREPGHWLGRFVAMASPCEVLVETTSEALARKIVEAAASCAWRIEQKYSRYRADNIVHEINSSAGGAITVDDETAGLLDFAATLTRMSDGAFDITSGVLRKIWRFDGGSSVPTQAQIDAVMPFVGWHRVQWRRPTLQLHHGMQIDFGGIGKEYAVDLAAADVSAIAPDLSCLINFGGDIMVRNPRHDGQPWRVAIEAFEQAGRSLESVSRRACHQRRLAPIRPARGTPLLAYRRRPHGLAGGRCAPFRDRDGQHLYASGNAHDACNAERE